MKQFYQLIYRTPVHETPHHMMNRNLLSLAISMMVSSSALFAQPGSVDPTFDPGEGPNARVFVTTLQPDGKVLIAGDFTEVSGQPRSVLARLNADGSASRYSPTERSWWVGSSNHSTGPAKA